MKPVELGNVYFTISIKLLKFLIPQGMVRDRLGTELFVIIVQCVSTGWITDIRIDFKIYSQLEKRRLFIGCQKFGTEWNSGVFLNYLDWNTNY